jgi:molybdopterin synthase catalytic subunit
MVQLTHIRIDVQAVIASVSTAESGGVDVFIGTTRNHSGGRAVLALEYEAYEPMALKVMERVAGEARRRWAVEKIAIVHRTGRVEVGEASVVIAVSSPHRREAFEACRYLIDRLKSEAPIWKREFFADGTVEWSGQPREQGVTTKND